MTVKLLKNNNKGKSSTRSEARTFWGNWLTAFIILLLLAGLYSCKDDENDPNPELLQGSWTRTFTGAETYHAQLNMKDGEWEWIILDTLSTHTNSVGNYEIINDQLRWYDNPDCPEDGLYNWSVTSNNLTLEAVDDACTPRVGGMAGTWDRLDTTVMHQLLGSWTKEMEAEGVLYDVKLTMNTSGELLWEMIDPIPGHTNSSVSFTVLDNVIIIYNDAECGGNGYFEFEIEGGTLTINTIKDSCPPRSPSFTGVWTRVK